MTNDLSKLELECDETYGGLHVRFKHPETRQTYQLSIYYTTDEESRNYRCVWGNVVLSVYSKRRSATSNERERKITGKDPMILLSFLKKAFPILEQAFIDNCESLSLPGRLRVCGTNQKRQKLYDRLLLTNGFQKVRDSFGGIEKKYDIKS